ncbi:MAG TPA: HAD family hydrolase [Myxococcales bacterium]|nr:HAD family hydrolase [Myxococcales bacterium]
MIRAVVTDLDNTVYSWVNYIVPSLEAMVASLCQTTGFPRIRVVQSLKEVYERMGTNDYSFAIQESSIFREFNNDFDSFRALIIEPAKDAFAAARRKYLQPYPGALEGLGALRASGVRVVGLTDAPRNSAEARVRGLSLDDWLESVYTLPGYPLPQAVDERIRQRESEGAYRSKIPMIELPAEHEKPDPRGLLRVLADLGIGPDEAFVVGDNRAKDGGMARNAGCRWAWAEYGTYLSLEYRERLDTISARSATRRHLSENEPGKPLPDPDFVLSNFAQVAGIVQALNAGEALGMQQVG